MMQAIRWGAALALGMAAAMSAGAATYRCQGADGKVTYGDRVCDANQQTTATLGAKGKVAPAASAAALPSASAASASTAANSRAPAPATAKR